MSLASPSIRFMSTVVSGISSFSPTRVCPSIFLGIRDACCNRGLFFFEQEIAHFLFKEMPKNSLNINRFGIHVNDSGNASNLLCG
jgi:hypothetical protein